MPGPRSRLSQLRSFADKSNDIRVPYQGWGVGGGGGGWDLEFGVRGLGLVVLGFGGVRKKTQNELVSLELYRF